MLHGSSEAWAGVGFVFGGLGSMAACFCSSQCAVAGNSLLLLFSTLSLSHLEKLLRQKRASAGRRRAQGPVLSRLGRGSV